MDFYQISYLLQDFGGFWFLLSMCFCHRLVCIIPLIWKVYLIPTQLYFGLALPALTQAIGVSSFFQFFPEIVLWPFSITKRFILQWYKYNHYSLIILSFLSKTMYKIEIDIFTDSFFLADEMLYSVLCIPIWLLFYSGYYDIDSHWYPLF